MSSHNNTHPPAHFFMIHILTLSHVSEWVTSTLSQVFISKKQNTLFHFLKLIHQPSNSSFLSFHILPSSHFSLSISLSQFFDSFSACRTPPSPSVNLWGLTKKNKNSIVAFCTSLSLWFSHLYKYFDYLPQVLFHP